MAIVWTPERRAAHGAKIREARAARKRPTQRRGITRGTPLSNDIDRALEAMKLIDRIGWPLARSLAARIEERT